MVDFTQINNSFNDFKETLNKFLVKPANTTGIAGYLFDIDLNQEVTGENDITDHFVEDNTAIQDHIAVRPRQFRLTGLVAEVVDNFSPHTALEFAEKLGPKLLPNSDIAPSFTPGVQLAQRAIQGDTADTLEVVGSQLAGENFTQSANIFSALRDNIPSSFEEPGINFFDAANRQSKQKQAYQFFEALRQQKALISANTPYGFFDNLAITSVSFRQGRETLYRSEVTIQLKEMRFARTDTVSIKVGQLRREQQRKEAALLQKQEGQQANSSILFSTVSGEEDAISVLTSSGLSSITGELLQ